ncbi:hypothetical protein BDV24DRAFT_145644, partial [Aspergillus arachidicola]
MVPLNDSGTVWTSLMLSFYLSLNISYQLPSLMHVYSARASMFRFVLIRENNSKKKKGNLLES